METAESIQTLTKLLGAGSVLTIVLLGFVIWFIKRLITKVDKIDVLEIQVKALVHEMKDFGMIRERVAALEALFKRKR